MLTGRPPPAAPPGDRPVTARSAGERTDIYREPTSPQERAKLASLSSVSAEKNRHADPSLASGRNVSPDGITDRIQSQTQPAYKLIKLCFECQPYKVYECLLLHTV